MTEILTHVFTANALLTAFAVVGLVMWLSNALSKHLTRGRVHGSAIAIIIGLAAAFAGGVWTGGEKGVADIPILAGIGLMGGAMLRDFAIVATAFEVETTWLVEAASRRQKWIDQAQSLNIYMAGASGKKLDDTYKLAWVRGLKTTYYLRTVGATHAEKSTVTAGRMNAVASGGAPVAVEARAIPTPAQPEQAAAVAVTAAMPTPATDIKYCAIDDPGCEACQ